MASASNLGAQIARSICTSIRDSKSQGLGIWMAIQEGGAYLESQASFTITEGKIESSAISMSCATDCDNIALDWLENPTQTDEPLWSILFCAVDSDGEFDIVPIYPDDSRLAQLKALFEREALDEARSILDRH